MDVPAGFHHLCQLSMTNNGVHCCAGQSGRLEFPNLKSKVSAAHFTSQEINTYRDNTKATNREQGWGAVITGLENGLIGLTSLWLICYSWGWPSEELFRLVRCVPEKLMIYEAFIRICSNHHKKLEWANECFLEKDLEDADETVSLEDQMPGGCRSLRPSEKCQLDLWRHS